MSGAPDLGPSFSFHLLVRSASDQLQVVLTVIQKSKGQSRSSFSESNAFIIYLIIIFIFTN